LHASNLVKNIKLNDAGAEFRCWGGDLMQQQGVTLVKHYRELAFMGFAEVIQHLPEILRNIKFCKSDILAYNPDVLILVDYPGFNLRIAKFAKKEGLKIVYYVSPQVWAWKSSRVHLIKEVVDKMLVIFPFEKSFYAKYNYAVDFVGHPLLDVISQSPYSSLNDFQKNNDLPDKPIVALLPGSRQQEIQNMLSVMLETAKHFPAYQFVIAGAPSAHKEWYESALHQPDVNIVYDKTYELLSHSSAALVTSGTATMEAALWGVPEVICYRAKGLTGTISYHLAKRLIGKKLKFIGIVNLVMEKEVVKELIQHELTAENLTEELKKLLEDKPYRDRIIGEYKQINEKLGGPGASARAANVISDFLHKNKKHTIAT
ncbi:MAG TPA: lipid-A-disaccharide synthase, partial [Bacteroidia bacterium]|nr:lipid-A-disaccharide synthase [Bacteroidia bacterium]